MRYFIKCSKCDNLISIKSEYMIMCPHCNKKLDNSYREWSARNTGGTFEKYLSEYCISEIAISGLSDQRKITRKIGHSGKVKRGIIAIILAILLVAAGVFGYQLYLNSQKGASIKAIMNDTWKINYYDDLAATVKFPFVLELQGSTTDTLPSVADSTQTITSFVSRSWSKKGVTAISATRVDFTPAYGINREAATQEILQAIVHDNEMRSFEFVPSDYTMGQGIKARMFSGSYLIKAEVYQFRAVMIVKGDTVWYFMVAYLRSMPEGTLLADKFFKGILL